MATVSPQELTKAITATFTHHGMSQDQASAAARAFVDAEVHHKPRHGATHVGGYVESLNDGTITAHPSPRATRRGNVVTVDADGGLAQFAIEAAWPDFVEATSQGVAVLAVNNTYTTGEMGFFARELSRSNLIGFVTTNSPAMVALGEDGQRAVGTNPWAFAVPGGMVVDQAITNAAFVAIKEYAENNESLPEGWAVDKHGKPTTDPHEAMEGALVPMGGPRGGNTALVTEMLAMMAGGLSSLDATTPVGESPQVGLFILGFNSEHFGGAERLTQHLHRLGEEYNVYIPGSGREPLTQIELDDQLWDSLNNPRA